MANATTFRSRQLRREGDGFRLELHLYPAGAAQSAHAHDETTISIVLAGTVRERLAGHDCRGRALDAVVKPAGTYHENRFEGARTLMLQIAIEPAWSRELLEAGAALARPRWSAAAHSAASFFQLARLLRESAQAETLRAGIEQLVAHLDFAPTVSSAAPRWLRIAKSRLDQAIGEGEQPPSVAELAAEASVHRVHLHRSFRQCYGVSPTDYRLRERMRHATDRLVAGEESLASVAGACGYVDQAHLNRDLRRQLGATPGELRRWGRGWSAGANGGRYSRGVA